MSGRALLAVLVPLVSAGCTGTENPLSTRTVVDTLHRQGYTHIDVHSARALVDQGRLHLPSHVTRVPDVDLILQSGAASTGVVWAFRVESNATARRSFAAELRLLHAPRLAWGRRAAASYAAEGMRIVRVCNALVGLLGQANPSERVRFDRVVATLRRRCSPG